MFSCPLSGLMMRTSIAFFGYVVNRLSDGLTKLCGIPGSLLTKKGTGAKREFEDDAGPDFRIGAGQIRSSGVFPGETVSDALSGKVLFGMFWVKLRLRWRFRLEEQNGVGRQIRTGNVMMTGD